MTNFTEKMDELQVQSAQQHTQMMDKLEAIRGEAFNIRTVVTVLNAINTTTTQNKDHLQVVRDNTTFIAQLGQQGNVTHLASKNILADMLVRFLDVQGNVNNLAVAMGTQGSNLSGNLLGRTNALLTAFNKALDSLGVRPTPEVGTVLQLLACVCEGTTGLLPPSPTDPTLEGYCSNPYKSDGALVLPFSLIGGTSVLFATFPPPPPGIAYGAVFGIADDTTELSSANWDEWRVFVESDQGQFSDGTGPFSAARFPTNEWLPMSGSGARAFSVDARGSIKVYICKNATGLPASCVELTTTPSAGIEDRDDFYNVRPNLVIWPVGYGAVSSTEGISPVGTNHMFSRDNFDVVLPGNFDGWRMRAITGGTLTAWTSGTFSGPYAIGSAYTTIMGSTEYLVVKGDTPNTQTVELCPPLPA